MQTPQQQIRAGSGVLALIGLGIIAVAVMLLVWVFGTHAESVEPGQHAVLNDKPIFWGHEGVRHEALTEGRMLVWDSTTSTKVSMLPEAFHVKFDDLSSSDNILLDFDSTIQLQVTDAVVLTKNFGKEWVNSNVTRQYMSVVREQVKQKTMPQMMSDVAAAVEVDAKVTEGLQKIIKDSGLPVRVLGVSLGRAKPNENVLLQMNETAAQQQRSLSLVAATAAEKQRELEQIAKARADNAYRNAMNLSPDQFVQLESIRRYSDACGKSPHCIVTSGQANVLLQGK